MQRIKVDELDYILQQTNNDWEQVRNKAIFLTGGTGFFGKWLAESFLHINRELALNANLTILSRSPENFLEKFPFYRDEPSIDFVKGDVLSFNFPDRAYNYIIHAATEADAALNSSKPLLMLDTITTGTRSVLDFALQNSIESFLFVSSGAVYGKQPAEVIHVKENQSFFVDFNNPLSAYAEGKRLAELYCSTYYAHYNLPVKIARCFAFIGPYLPLDKHFAVGNFLLNAMKGEDIIIKGDGTPYRSYLYAADLAVSLWKILLKGATNKPYNVGSDEDYNLRTVAEIIAELTPGVAVKVLTKAVAGKPVERYVPNIDLLKSDLGLGNFLKLRDAIVKTKEFYNQGYR